MSRAKNVRWKNVVVAKRLCDDVRPLLKPEEYVELVEQVADQMERNNPHHFNKEAFLGNAGIRPEGVTL